MKSYNWKKGILFLIICAFVGALVGGGVRHFIANGDLQEVTRLLVAIAPSLFVIALCYGMVGLGGYFYFNAKLKKEQYSNEEDTFYDRHKKAISIVQTCSTLCAIINFTALGVNLFNKEAMVSLFFVNGLLAFIGEVAYISLHKKVRPELNADPLQVNFNKNYYDQLDECEKHKTGKASFQTLAIMTPVYVLLFVGCYMISIIFKVSPIICLPVGIIWLVQTLLLIYYANKESNAN